MILFQTLHFYSISIEKSPSKSIINDSSDDKRKSASPIHNQDQVDHINSCYDEIRAKYFNTNKRNPSSDDTLNRLDKDSIDQQILTVLDDPLLQARKQTNIKLNCLLNGYNLTRSFANHEKAYGQNEIFKFHHYYDVGKRRYDYNYTTNNTNRLFTEIRNKPLSKSIDSFRHFNHQDDSITATLDKNKTNENKSLGKRKYH